MLLETPARRKLVAAAARLIEAGDTGAAMLAVDTAFREQEHPRGQPENPGQFVKGGSKASKKPEVKKPSEKKASGSAQAEPAASEEPEYIEVARKEGGETYYSYVKNPKYGKSKAAASPANKREPSPRSSPSSAASGKWKDAPMKAAPLVPIRPYDEKKFRAPSKDDKVPGTWIDVKVNPDPKADVQMVGTIAKSRNKITKYSADYIERSKENQKKWPAWAQKLKIPPMATDVQLSTDPNAKILAKYVDSTGNRKDIQNPKFTAERTKEKYTRNRSLAGKFEKIQARIEKDLHSINFSVRQLAQCESLLQLGPRVGGGTPSPNQNRKVWDDAAKKGWSPWALKLKHLPEYGSSGVVTLRAENVQEEGGKMYLRFIGKEAKPNQYEITNPATKQWLREAKKSADGPGGWIFPDVTRTDVDKYSKSLGIAKTKDLRTLQARSVAESTINGMEPPESLKDFEQKRKEVGAAVSRILNNGPTMALKSYVDTGLFQDWPYFKDWIEKERSKGREWIY